MARKNSVKKSLLKRPATWIVAGVLAVGAVAGGGGDKEDPRDIPTEPDKSIVQVDVTDKSAVVDMSEPVVDKKEDDTIKAGSYTLPCGMKINFSPTVRNDVTGNWRLSTTSDSFVPADCALEYYQEMFSCDDEIHGIWNATLKTMTKISTFGGLLYTVTYEYVNGEEHDAKIMFSGALLDSRIIDLETGEPLEDTSNNETDISAQPAEQETPGPAASNPDPGKTQEPTEPKDPPKNTNSAGKERRSNWSSGDYLGSLESNKYHDYECWAAKKILPENEIWFSSEEDAQAAGYSRCGNCW